MNKDKIRKNNNKIYYDYKIRDKVMLNSKDAFKYKIPYNRTLGITQCW